MDNDEHSGVAVKCRVEVHESGVDPLELVGYVVTQ